MAKLVGDVAPLDITEVVHPAHELVAKRIVVGVSRSDVSDARGFARLLRLRRERPHNRCAANERDEIPTPHGAYPKAKGHGPKYSSVLERVQARAAQQSRPLMSGSGLGRVK